MGDPLTIGTENEDCIAAAQNAFERVVKSLDLRNGERRLASGNQCNSFPGVVVAVFVAAQNFIRGLSDRAESGDIAVIIGVEYDAVSGFFYFETRVSDPCDFHSFSPFLKQVLSKRRVHRKHCNAILGVLQPLWCHLKEFRSHYFAFSKSSSRRAPVMEPVWL